MEDAAGHAEKAADVKGHSATARVDVLVGHSDPHRTSDEIPSTTVCTVITSRIRHSQAKCIVRTAVCLSVCVCLSLVAFLQYCVQPECNFGEW